MPEPQFWEFLIQQEGDRSWLPIDTPTVEILEGRYRIAAKSNLKNAPLEVLITYDALHEDPPVRRSQQRFHQTNSNGLIAIIPYTSLKPGRWTFTCSSEAIDDSGREGWKRSVQLYSLQQEVHEEWQPDWDGETSEALPEPTLQAIEPTPVEPTPVGQTPIEQTPIGQTVGGIAPPERLTQPSEFSANSSADAPEVVSPRESEAPATALQAAGGIGASVEAVLHHFGQMSESIADEVLSEYDLLPESEENAPEPEIVPAIARALPPLEISLEQDNFVARRGETIVLSGAIAPADDAIAAPSNLNQAVVKVILRDPQSSEILLETEEPMQNQSLPTDLTYWVTLPSTLKTRLILGEILLQDVSQPEPQLLARQSFSLTADLAELLETIAEHRTVTEDVVADKLVPGQADALSLTFLDFVDTAKPIQLRPLDTSAEKSLPPLLTNPSNSIAPNRPSLDLPDFSNRSEQNEAPHDPESEEVVSSVEEPADPAFEALNLQDRFIDRLNSLAADVDQEQEVEQEQPPQLPTHPEAGVALPEADDLLTPSEMLLYKDANPALYEFVVDDEPIVPIAHLTLARKPKPQPDPTATNPFLLPEDQPIPTPTLDIPKAELVAGESVEVRVKLPDLRPKIYVKLWISDRQSRRILESPRWLVDFTPDGFDHLETTTQLTVPKGSVEIEIEAIAVEMASQRESHKVSVERSVTPAEVSELEIEEFTSDSGMSG